MAAAFLRMRFRRVLEDLRGCRSLLGARDMADPVQNRCGAGRGSGGSDDGELSSLGGLDTLVVLGECGGEGKMVSSGRV